MWQRPRAKPTRLLAVEQSDVSVEGVTKGLQLLAERSDKSEINRTAKKFA
jgi:hypothetical protein